MKSARSLAVLLITATACLAPHALAQCTPVPNTGCPGALGPTCTGSTRIGQQITIACTNNGRAPLNYLLIGPCEAAPVAAPPVLLCVPGPCNLGVTLGLAVAVPNLYTPVTIPIPADTTLVGVQVCTQCIDVLFAQQCVTLSEAESLVIMP